MNSTPRPTPERAMKLIERFAELYGSDRLELMDALRGLGERDTNERLIFCIVEVTDTQFCWEMGFPFLFTTNRGTSVTSVFISLYVYTPLAF